MSRTQILVTIQQGASIVNHTLSLPETEAITLSATIGACRDLMPGEVAQRLSHAIAPLDLRVEASEVVDAVPIEPPPPGPVDLTPPASDPPSGLDSIPASPAPEPIDPAAEPMGDSSAASSPAP